jgi:hypothetical protein
MPSEGEALADAVVTEGARTADWLRSRSPARLGRAEPASGAVPLDRDVEGRTLAEVAWHLAEWLAVAGQAIEAQQPVRPLPRLSDRCVGDQVAVLAADLAAAGRRDDAGLPVLIGNQQWSVAQLLGEAARRLRGIRGAARS